MATYDEFAAESNAWRAHSRMPPDIRAEFERLLATDPTNVGPTWAGAADASKWIARSRKAREAMGIGGSLGTNIAYGAAGLLVGALLGFGLSRLGR